MSDSAAHRFQRLFAWLSILLFGAFFINIFVGKYAVMTKAHIPVFSDLTDFLLLFFASGCFIAYTACLRNFDMPEDNE